MGIIDPFDHLTFEIQWGDGTTEDKEIFTNPADIMFTEIFHDYNQTGIYNVIIKIEDWSGEVYWQNGTLEIREYRPVHLKKDTENLILTIILVVLATIFLVGILVVLGYVGYRFSKKDTEVEFDLKSLKSDIEKQKPGTGTDFDKRRGMQIPKESIMIRGEAKKEEEDGVEEAVKPKSLPLIKGKVTFEDDDEE